MREITKSTLEDLPTSFELQPVQWEERGGEGFPSEVAAKCLSHSEIYRVPNSNGVTRFISLWTSDDHAQVYGKVFDVIGEEVIGATSFMNSQYDKTPTIGSTHTFGGYSRKGLAAMRTAIINQICKERLGMPIHASLQRSSDANAFWERLVAEGLAKETFTPNGNKTYYLV